MNVRRPLIEQLPDPAVVRYQLGSALREVELLRGLLRLSERAEHYRECDRAAAEADVVPSRRKTACGP